jgi:hypothetical protein
MRTETAHNFASDFSTILFSENDASRESGRKYRDDALTGDRCRGAGQWTS